MDVQVALYVTGGIHCYFLSLFSQRTQHFMHVKNIMRLMKKQKVFSLTTRLMIPQQLPISVFYCRAMDPRARNISQGKCPRSIAESWYGNHRDSLHPKTCCCITRVPFTVLYHIWPCTPQQTMKCWLSPAMDTEPAATEGNTGSHCTSKSSNFSSF